MKGLKDLLSILAGFVLFAVIVFAFREPEPKPEIFSGHSFMIENEGLYLGNVATRADGVVYYSTGWGPKENARRYGEWIRAYEASRDWGGRILIVRYDE